MDHLIMVGMGVLLVLAAIEDLKDKKIHVWLIALILIVGILGASMACTIETANLWQTIGGLTIGFCMIGFSFISRGQIGMADGVIITALGLFCGARDCLVIVSIASIAMALISIVLLIFQKGSRHTQIPFVPALLVGFCITGWIR